MGTWQDYDLLPRMLQADCVTPPPKATQLRHGPWSSCHYYLGFTDRELSSQGLRDPQEIPAQGIQTE